MARRTCLADAVVSVIVPGRRLAQRSSMALSASGSKLLTELGGGVHDQLLEGDHGRGNGLDGRIRLSTCRIISTWLSAVLGGASGCFRVEGVGLAVGPRDRRLPRFTSTTRWPPRRTTLVSPAP